MTPTRIVMVERIGLLLGIAAMIAAVSTLDWRAGLFFAGGWLVILTSDFRIGRRP